MPMDELLSRAMPHSPEAEQAVLGSVLIVSSHAPVRGHPVEDATQAYGENVSSHAPVRGHQRPGQRLPLPR